MKTIKKIFATILSLIFVLCLSSCSVLDDLGITIDFSDLESLFSTSTKENTTESISHITYTDGENNGPTSYPEYDTYEKGTLGSPCSLKDVIEYTASHGRFDDVTDLFYFYAYIESFTQLDEYHYDITIYVDEGELYKVDLKNVYVGPTSYIPYVEPPETGVKAAFTGRVGLFYDSEIGFYDNKFVSSELSIYAYFEYEMQYGEINYEIGDFYTYEYHCSAGVIGRTITLQFKCYKDDFNIIRVYNDNGKEKIDLEYSVENKILTVILTVEEFNNIYIEYDLVYDIDFGTEENPITIAYAVYSFDSSNYLKRQKWTISGVVEEVQFGGEEENYYTSLKLAAGEGVERLFIKCNVWSPLNVFVGDCITVSCYISSKEGNNIIYCNESASIVKINQEIIHTTLEAMARSTALKNQYIKMAGVVTSIKSDTEITIKSDNPEITIKSSSLAKYKDQFAVGDTIIVTGQFIWDSPYSIVDYGKKTVEIISVKKASK